MPGFPTTGGTLLATGFIADNPEEGTHFPSAGGNSGDPRVQAVYWRCLVAFFASARITNPGQRLALFSNVAAPRVDGVDIGAVLAGLGVEYRRVPLTARLGAGKTSAWGNVLYFFDIMAALADEDPDLRFALTDSDVLVTGDLAPLFGLLDQADFAGYRVDTAPDDNVNGLSRKEMQGIAQAMGGAGDQVLDHFGGELFMATPRSWAQHQGLFHAMLADAEAGTGAAARVRTEEHIYSIAFGLLPGRVAQANRWIKRIWTSPRHNTAAAGDETLPIWHLPAEKRYGLRDIFSDLHRTGFARSMDAQAFRRLAMRRCGVPRKGTGKILRDGLRQVGAKLGWFG